MRNLWFTICIFLSITAFAAAAAAQPLLNVVHPPVLLIQDRFTPAQPSAVRLNGWLGRYVDAVRDDFVLRKDLVSMYLRPLQQHGDRFWEAEHIGKWLDAASTMWQYSGDPRIRELMDEAVSVMLATQAPNGWLGSYDEPYRYYQLNWNGLSKPTAWDTYYGWDLWCNFTSLEGLLKYHWATTNDSRALMAAQRIGDLVVQTFGAGKQDIVLVAHDNGAGAMTLLLAFAHLYEATGEPGYLDFCGYLMCQFGRPHTIPIILAGAQGPEAGQFPFSKDGAILKHTETELTLSGLCELYRITRDPVLLATSRNVYDAGYAPLIKTMCLSGYTAPKIGVEVPRTVRPKVEMCDTPATVRWWVEMFQLTGDARYLNAIERQVYNQLLAHRTLSGLGFAYMPYQHFDSPSGCFRRYGSLGPFDCCWSMGPVGFSDLPRWSYFTSSNGVLVNFYEPSSFQGMVNGVAIRVEQQTEYPLEGQVEIAVKPEKPVKFELNLRIPDWCVAADISRPIHRPGGTSENSPAFQRRVELANVLSPKGTTELDRLSRPFGTYSSPTSNPALKRRAILNRPSRTKIGKSTGRNGPLLSEGQGGLERSSGGHVVSVNGQAWEQRPQPGTILTIEREWHSGDIVTLEFPMPARVTCPIESAPGYCAIERGPLVLAMSQRFNKTGDGWCYAAPVLDEDGALRLKRTQLKDSAGQASVGWQMEAMGRFDISGRIFNAKFPATLVPFSDAGAQAEPYVAGFPLPKTIDSLPPRLGPNFAPDIAALRQGANAMADSEERESMAAAKAIDGDPTTAWRAGSTPYPHWIDVRLPQRKRIGRIVIRFGDPRDHPVDFKVLAAAEACAPREILSVTGCNISDYFWARFESVEADSLRLVVQKSSGDSTDAPISEIDVYQD